MRTGYTEVHDSRVSGSCIILYSSRVSYECSASKQESADACYSWLLEDKRGRPTGCFSNISTASSQTLSVYFPPLTCYQLAQPIRLLLKYTGTEFENITYEQGDGMCCFFANACAHKL